MLKKQLERIFFDLH